MVQINPYVNARDRVLTDVREACRRANRAEDDVDIIAVTKTVLADAIPDLLSAGLVQLAENRWQVARDKLEHPRASEATWHFIGSLQTNKAKYVCQHFSVVHSVDRLELAEALSRESVKQNRCLRILLQVNVAEEPQKHGMYRDDVKDMVMKCRGLPNLQVLGLMTMAPNVEHVEETRPIFRELKSLLVTIQHECSFPEFNQLSMGMSGDYVVAVEEGATMIRLGRRLVGPMRGV